MRPDAEVAYDTGAVYSLRASVFGLTWSGSDPSRWFRQGTFAMAARWGDGPATLAVRQRGARILTRAWGPGASDAVAQAPELVGLLDRPDSWDPQHPRIRALHARSPGLRLGATRRVFRELVPTVLGQLVTTKDAAVRWRRLVRRYGEPAPGPLELLLPPDAGTLARFASWRFGQLDIPGKQGEAIRRAAERADRLEEAVWMDHDAGMARLQAIRGVGPWTAATALATATGFSDTVILGDLHLPKTVAWALERQREADDARMLQLLEPFRPHRYRVLRLLFTGGQGPGRRAPIEGYGRGRRR